MHPRHRRFSAVALAVVVGAGLVIAPPVSAAEPGGDPELGPLIGGTSSYVDGTYVWTDYAYDDRGPNLNVLAGGDSAYPAEPYPGNTADIIQLQLGAAEEGSLQVSFVLNTLVEGAEADLGVGFDTDRDPWTGAATVPGGQWMEPLLGLDAPAPKLVEKPKPLGLEALVVLSTTGTGTLLSFDGAAWSEVESFDVEVDRDSNAVSAEVVGLQPGTSVWNAVGVAGMADEAGSWVNGSQPIYDLAFVRDQEAFQETAVGLTYQVPQVRSQWQDDIQSNILAGHLTPIRWEQVVNDRAVEVPSDHDAVATVEFGTDRTELAQPSAPGLETFLYHSRVDLGEGIRQTPSLRHQGRYQPYVVYIPSGLAPDGLLPHNAPMVVFLHGANQNHMTNAVHFAQDGLVVPGSYYDVDAVVIFPHGRDTGWGSGAAEKDLLDATDDAVARLGIDTDRMVLTGVSAGGSGSFRTGTRYPDRWAGIYPQVGGGTSIGENLTNVPVRTHYSGPAEYEGWQNATASLTAAGTVDFRAAWVATKVHMPVQMGNCWYQELLATPRDVNPARVRYTVPAAVQVDENTVLAPDGAYWVSGLKPREEETGSIDALALTRSDRSFTATDFSRTGENIVSSADFCGPHRNMHNLIIGDVWMENGRDLELADPEPVSNSLVLTLAGLGAATVDVDRVGIETTQPVILEITGDGPAQLTLVGPWSGDVEILRNGTAIDVQTADGSVVIDDDFDGSSTYSINPGA